MISFKNLTYAISPKLLNNFVLALKPTLLPILTKKHGDSPRWEEAILSLPEIKTLRVNLEEGVIIQGLTDEKALYAALKVLKPWRKGPFQLSEIFIDTEWRSDFKWDRLAPYVDFHNKVVLDVGCGNSYYGFRMVGAGAKAVLGIDPNWLYLYQFLVIKKYLPQAPIWQLPLTLEDTLKIQSSQKSFFDIVLSMGVLYHRRSPIDHLFQLKEMLTPNGELILETLIIAGDKNTLLTPVGRYAQMRNVWFIPSVETLILWLKRVGFKEIEVLDITKTTKEEQRATKWMEYLSLADFLDPKDPNKTIEGYPAPIRVMIKARNA